LRKIKGWFEAQPQAHAKAEKIFCSFGLSRDCIANGRWLNA
jgi:hypothetical protein